MAKPFDLVPKIAVPVLLLVGDKDDSPLKQTREMHDALQKAGKVVELVVYSGAYHLFDRGHPSGKKCAQTREGRWFCFDEKAKQDAWNRTLSWLNKYLRTN